MRRLSSAVVVGGAGFVGSWVVEALGSRGIPTAVVDPRERPADRLGSDVRDERFGAVLAEVDADVVFQLAGTGLVPLSVARPQDDLALNTMTTLAVLEAARRQTRPPLIVLVSSAAVYGEARTVPMREDHPLDPVSPYGVSKVAAETYLRLYQRLYGISGFAVRPFSLYGPRQRKLVVFDLLLRILQGEDPLRIDAPAEAARDFVYVEDAAQALVTLAQSAPAAGEAYNIASGRGTTLGELGEALIRAGGRGGRCEFTGSLRAGDPLRWEGDASLARSLGATFDTPLEVGLRRTAEWLKSTIEHSGDSGSG